MKGPNAPPAPIAGMMWLDDDTPSASVWTLKLYDGADWISIATFDISANTWAPAIARLALGAGSAGVPALTLGDPDTGIYGPAAGEIALAINGSDAYRIRATGIKHQIYGSDGSSIYLISGTTRGLRVTTDASSVNLEGVDQTGVVSYQPLALKASEIVFATGSSPSERMRIPASGPISLTGDVDVAGNLRFNSGYGSAALAYGVRAWVNFNGTGTVAIRGSGGVTSITDNGAGRYTMNFNFTMPDANYAALATGNANSDSFAGNRQFVMIRTRSTTSLQVNTVDDGGVEADPSFLSVIVVR